MIHVGDIMSTIGGVQYRGGCSVQVEEYNDACGGIS